jgi:hypothetical protein
MGFVVSTQYGTCLQESPTPDVIASRLHHSLSNFPHRHNFSDDISSPYSTDATDIQIDVMKVVRHKRSMLATGFCKTYLMA